VSGSLRRLTAAAALASCALTVRPAAARLDVEDRGPVLDAGAFSMRVTNAGILGNAFFDVGRSFDPSLEFPRGSGHEALGHAELWVGARALDGALRISGGPALEWRPTLDSSDVVLSARAGAVGSLWNVDDDHDGRLDEDPLNGRDDDGDGRVDEDYGMTSDQLLVSEYRDDEPASINYAYANGEAHRPMHLDVVQEARTWALPGYDRVAGYEFTVTNTGDDALRDVRIGVYADLDSRHRSDSGGHVNDLITDEPYDVIVPEGLSVIQGSVIMPGPNAWLKSCVTTFQGTVPVVSDGVIGSGLPAVCLIGLSHTTDPLGYLVNYAFPGVREAQAQARAPRRDTTFRYSVFSAGFPAGQGGPPVVDADRYAAMGGTYPQAPRGDARDWAVLLSCGPFARLAPGEKLQMQVAFVVAPDADSAAAGAVNARMLWRGTRYSFQPDVNTTKFDIGTTGINGHEICYEPPPGIVFNYDPHCPTKFFFSEDYKPPPDPALWLHDTEATYSAGHCIWTDLDCDACTGFDGKETHVPWQVGGLSPPKPALAVQNADSTVTIAWDNTPEIVLRQPGGWNPEFRFGGYRVYRLDNWHRETILPAPATWQRIAAFRPAGLEFAGPPLQSITDFSIPPDGSIYGQVHYPIGRYRFVDREVRYGFDYLYVVTTVFTKLTFVNADPVIMELESPLTAAFGDRVVPHSPSVASPRGVWVVPNPYRAAAAWERTSVPGDVFTRHLDFMGLPRARATIRIYTLAGDLVQVIDHDGSNGDGQAPWDLISRNGQDVESGIYLFTVESALGHQVGRFVVIR
jgi:hypothetical protein